VKFVTTGSGSGHHLIIALKINGVYCSYCSHCVPITKKIGGILYKENFPPTAGLRHPPVYLLMDAQTAYVSPSLYQHLIPAKMVRQYSSHLVLLTHPQPTGLLSKRPGFNQHIAASIDFLGAFAQGTCLSRPIFNFIQTLLLASKEPEISLFPETELSKILDIFWVKLGPVEQRAWIQLAQAFVTGLSNQTFRGNGTLTDQELFGLITRLVSQPRGFPADGSGYVCTLDARSGSR
jgi:hypothetical protein